MALGSVLVDRARVVRNERLSVKVEGSTVLGEVRGEWFKARLTKAGTPWQPDPQRARTRVVETDTLLYGLKDVHGNAIDLHAEDAVEVTSGNIAAGTYRLTAEPSPLRKKRKVIGYTVTLVREDARSKDRVARVETRTAVADTLTAPDPDTVTVR